MGNSHSYLQQNWQECCEKLQRVLTRWKGLSKFLSYRGKALIANQLAASKLYHVLAFISPPQETLKELQKKLVNFVWSDGRYWLKEKILYYPPEKGGLGLSCLDARALTFRFTMLQRFLGNSLHPVFTRTFFQRAPGAAKEALLFTSSSSAQLYNRPSVWSLVY